ncbi:MAG: serine/threonine protein kinase [Lachnospiraceae bacterium]|nr:serine/threonine protein kinase [Lachnospiraceae bacterium]
MIINKLDSIEFRLKELHDFTWLKKYGTAFWCVDQTGSGCICIGMENKGKKYFCKIAGVNTIEAEVSPKESIEILKESVHLYHDLKHPNLVKIIEDYNYKQFYVVVFEWTEGECLFDHWNFEKYQENLTIKSPKEKFRQLSVSKKLSTIDVLFSFLQNVNKKGYVAVDFYDGSIMYDFLTDKTTICDIDFFKKAPVINNKGPEWFGTKRLKAPEEYIKGSAIDEQTNIFTLGALIFDFFGYFSDEEIRQRYQNNQFIPCSYSNWELNEESYQVASRAVRHNKNERYMTFSEFFRAWNEASSSMIPK